MGDGHDPRRRSRHRPRRVRACDHAAMAEWIDAEGAAATMRAARLEPLEPFADADQPWRCRCLTCSRVVTPRLSGIAAGGGCKYCATKGLDLNAPAVILVLTNPDLNVHVIDFDAADGDVADRLTSRGWQVVKSASVPTVEDAYEIRAAVLRWLRLEQELPGCLAAGDAPEGRGDASVDGHALAASDIWARVSDELSRRRRKRRAAGGARSGR
jgi:hypothetical protein